MNAESRAPLPLRFWRYLQERFALPAYLPLITTFTFASASYSRLLRGDGAPLAPATIAVGSFTALTAFLWLRILDEHKDAAGDRAHRPELPVPRGLISLAELRALGGGLALAALLLSAWISPALLGALAVVLLLLFLTAREFFVRGWLAPRLGWYMLSHMLIMPAIDAYTTGLDWLAGGHRPLPGLWLFLLLTYVNGCVLEMGRKIRAPEQERHGVDTYSAHWGAERAAWMWGAALVVAGLLLLGCLLQLHPRWGFPGTYWVLLAASVLCWVCGYPARRFFRKPCAEDARAIEWSSGLWVLLSYLLLGVLPLLFR